MMNLLSGKKSAIESMESASNKITNNSLVIFLLMLLCASQVVTFVRLKEHQDVLSQQDRIINELVSGQESLFEIIRLQEKLRRLKLYSPEEPVAPKWNLNEI